MGIHSTQHALPAGRVCRKWVMSTTMQWAARRREEQQETEWESVCGAYTSYGQYASEQLDIGLQIATNAMHGTQQNRGMHVMTINALTAVSVLMEHGDQRPTIAVASIPTGTRSQIG
jgi:hypothetical protein